ncbi:UDP-N-acetylglucosamine transferase subunit ALG14 [Luteolibacter flavescens]|uniref:UDP-N-acetylglucosamine transferase subunit ALG14 n=1 Tax=Luteolibacter flavescens TaxID=1859460 RepID=A0ABT3FTT9_9BACT|nr:UDP-N-acetylglucosamine transferase subunit ALG14 [Luteolibacter flavescens]MCW1886998.1 UDP-N-acetylglucosamine transferase subunit ALG14 [Luteolibacter flavescens]
MPALDGMDVFYVSLDKSLAADVPGHDFYTIRDVSRRDRFGFIIVAFQLLKILFKERPKLVITTGSAPALIALLLSKYLFGSKTIWIDSIANAEKLSSSGKKAGKIADLWLTQWPQLSGPGGPQHWGAVL